MTLVQMEVRVPTMMQAYRHRKRQANSKGAVHEACYPGDHASKDPGQSRTKEQELVG